MDQHDKEFETFLRQFRLRQPGPLHEKVSSRRRPVVRFALGAAAVVLLGFLSVLMLRNHNSIRGPVATVTEAGSPSLYMVGEEIEAGNVIRSNSAKGLILGLEDGSQVEMHEQSELKLEAAGDGIRVRLNDGSILVTAAKQGSGHLYVQTKDAAVSVVGTVFLVHAEQAGTCVAVLEGEVHVQQGTEVKNLLPGEQVATNPAIQMKTMAEEISWSRKAPEYLAMLPQTAPEVPGTRPAIVGGNNEADLLSKYNDAYRVDVKSKEPLVWEPTRLGTNTLPYKVQANYVKLTTDSVRTLITVEILTRDLAFHDEGGAQLATPHITGIVYRSDNKRMAGSSFSQDMFFRYPTRKALQEGWNRPIVYQVTTYLAPGKYKLHLTVEDNNGQSVKSYDVLLSPPQITDQTLQASSMILAYSVTDLPPNALGTEMFALGRKNVKPNPSGVFRTDETLNVWQEFYGLTSDPVTHKPAADIELLISQNKQEIKRLIRRASEFAGSGPQVTYTDSVSLAEFAPGQYDVQIKVTDNLAKQSFVTTGTFSVLASLAPQEQTQSTPPKSAPPADSPGRSIFYRACTTCHSAEVTINSSLSTRAEYANLVSRQLGMGASVSSAEVPVLVDYLFETFGKKPGPPTPSDLPLQKQ